MQVEAIFHPLSSTTLEKQECHDHVNMNNWRVGVQSVRLDDAIYIAGNENHFNHAEWFVLHKYSLMKKSWYKIPTKVANYALATYRSKVVMIGGVKSGPEKFSEKVFHVLEDDNCGLEEELNQSLYQRTDLEEKFRMENACAVSDGDYLIVAGGDSSNNSPKIVRVFNGDEWHVGKINAESRALTRNVSGRKLNLCIHGGNVYLTHRHNTSTQFFCTALEPLKNPNFPMTDNCTWNKLEDAPHSSDCSSLMVLGNHVVTVSTIGGYLRSYAYLPQSSNWVIVEEVPIFQQFTAFCVVALDSPNPTNNVESLIVGKRDHHSLFVSMLKLTTKRMFKLTIGLVRYNHI